MAIGIIEYTLARMLIVLVFNCLVFNCIHVSITGCSTYYIVWH